VKQKYLAVLRECDCWRTAETIRRSSEAATLYFKTVLKYFEVRECRA
jgi:hypothetical protein